MNVTDRYKAARKALALRGRDSARVAALATAIKALLEPPAFAPDGEADYYRSQWERLKKWEANSLDDGEGGQYPWGDLKITGGTVAGHTQWINITEEQAKFILAYLSEQNRITT